MADASEALKLWIPLVAFGVAFTFGLAAWVAVCIKSADWVYEEEEEEDEHSKEM